MGVYVEVIFSFRSLRAGAQVFVLLMLFLCVIVHNIWSGKSLHFLCILPFIILCSSAIRIMFVKILLAGVWWWVLWSERKRTLCLW